VRCGTSFPMVNVWLPGQSVRTRRGWAQSKYGCLEIGEQDAVVATADAGVQRRSATRWLFPEAATIWRLSRGSPRPFGARAFAEGTLSCRRTGRRRPSGWGQASNPTGKR